MQEPWIQSLSQEDHLEKGLAPHSSILAWRIPWTEEPGRLQYIGLQRVGYNWETNTFTSLQGYEYDVKIQKHIEGIQSQRTG